MNPTDIEYLNWTWNYTTGCTKGCAYCWARNRAHTRLKSLYLSNDLVASGCNPNDPFSPRYWPGRKCEPCYVTKPGKIGVSFMGDLFDHHVPNDWINEVLSVVDTCHWHTFLFLTKQPKRMAQFEFPDNAWCGITRTGAEWWQLGIPAAVKQMQNLEAVKAKVKYISYEPLLELPWVPESIQWIIIGAMTGKDAVRPPNLAVTHILNAADRYEIPVFIKDNLKWPEQRQEYPKEQ